jgi:hypothetical protein
MKNIAMTLTVVIVAAFCITVFCMWGNHEDMKVENRILRAENAELMYENDKLRVNDYRLNRITQKVERNREYAEDTLRILKERLGVQ